MVLDGYFSFNCLWKAIVVLDGSITSCKTILNSVKFVKPFYFIGLKFGPRGVFNFTEFFNDLHLNLSLGLVWK